MENNNYLNLRGIEFIEFSSHDPKSLHELFSAFGFSKMMRHETKKIDLYKQNDIVFLLNFEPQSFGHNFFDKHGPCVSSMAWKFDDPKVALDGAVQRGGRRSTTSDYKIGADKLAALVGIGESNIYFLENNKKDDFYKTIGFKDIVNPELVPNLGFDFIDHLTNNVEKGEMKTWSDFYRNIFGFTEIKYFDIDGAKTGLTSYALQSPCGTFCIPINEAKDEKSQISEYLEVYKGPGVQHIALHSSNIIESVEKLEKTGIETLDIDAQYYQEVFDRVPGVTEDKKALERNHILIDGDEEGYLLQIFTKNIIGPIFFEIIQRKNHHAFGEGNFGALFRSIERDQEKRGYLK